jgi:16S rRNA (guanine527-N7)-methyltransferase
LSQAIRQPAIEPVGAEAKALAAASTVLGLDLTRGQQVLLLEYLALIGKWNAVYNLTAIRDPDRMLTHHLFDCLAIVPHLCNLTNRRPFSLLDVGSGAGLPGVVIAICVPQAVVTCIDAVGKKAAFLRQAKAILGLANLSVAEGRVEQLNGTFDVVASRAFASLAQMVASSAHLLAGDGVFAAMKGAVPADEIQALPAGWEAAEVIPLTVPGLDAARHLVVVKRAD